MLFEEREPIWTGSALQLIGREVRASRHRLGWTQHDLARAVRLSQSTISRIEHGRNRTLKLERFGRIVLVLGWVGTREDRIRALATPEPPAWAYFYPDARAAMRAGDLRFDGPRPFGEEEARLLRAAGVIDELPPSEPFDAVHGIDESEEVPSAPGIEIQAGVDQVGAA